MHSYTGLPLEGRDASRVIGPLKLVIACALAVLLVAPAQATSDQPVEALRDGKSTVAGQPYIRTVAQLAADLRGDDSSARGLALGVLRRLTEAEATALLALLPSAFDPAGKSVNWEIVRAYDQLGEVAAERHYADLLGAIEDGTPKDAHIAMQKIRPSPAQREAVVVALLEIFDDPATRNSIRFQTASQLAKHGASERLASHIEPMLDHPKRKVRTHAVALLATPRMPSEFAVPLLEKAMDNSMRMVVDHAIGALFSKHRPESAHEIAAKKTVDLIMTADNSTRSSLLGKLGSKRLQASSAVPLLLTRLESTSRNERIYAIQALAQLRDVARPALEPLEALARDAEPTTQRFAAKAVECINDPYCRGLSAYRREAAYLP